MSFALAALVACQSPQSRPSLAPAASLTKPTEEATKAAVEAEKPLQQAEAATATLPDSATRTDLTASLAKLRAWWSSNLAAWQNAAASAKELDKAVKDRDSRIKSLTAENARLTKADPLRWWLGFIGIMGLVGSLAILIGSFFISWEFLATPKVRSFAVAGVVLSCCLMTLSRFMTQVYWISGGVIVSAIIAGAIYLYGHRKIAKVKAVKAAKLAAVKLVPFGDVPKV